MNPTARLFWLTGMIFATVIDVATTYILLEYGNDHVAGISSSERSPIVLAHELLPRFGSAVTILLIMPLIVAGVTFLIIRFTDRYWPDRQSRFARLQILHIYTLLFGLLSFKLYVAAWNTRLVLGFFYGI